MADAVCKTGHFCSWNKRVCAERCIGEVPFDLSAKMHLASALTPERVFANANNTTPLSELAPVPVEPEDAPRCRASSHGDCPWLIDCKEGCEGLLRNGGSRVWGTEVPSPSREPTLFEIEQQRQGRARSCVTKPKSILPTSSAERKDVPLYRGTVAYFPRALAYVSKVSLYGAIKHCDGVLEWRKGKSTDHADCVARHLVEHGTIDPESGLRHSGYLAWRALALLEMELEAEAAGITVEALIKRYQEKENAK